MLSSSRSVCVLFFVVAFLSLNAQAHIGCTNMKGESVDWWVMLKSSVVTSSANPIASDGFAFVYLDSNSVHDDATFKTFPTTSLQNSTHALAQTLNQIYNTPASDQTGYFMYNDETPEGKTSSYYAHAKGAAMFDKDSGFWLVHSTPRFPHQRDGTPFVFPDNERIYGQSYLCLSLDAAAIDDAGEQLAYMNPQLYASDMPSSLSSTYPKLTSMLNGNHFTTPGASHIAHITTVGGQKFTSFAKNAKWGKDLYSDLVSPEIGEGLYLETWMRPYEPSCCTPKCQYPSVNVKEVALSPNSDDMTFIETKDHSKWGISFSSNWACVGGINRNQSQWKRGGGTVCTMDGALWKAFKQIIKKIDDSCPV